MAKNKIFVSYYNSQYYLLNSDESPPELILFDFYKTILKKLNNQLNFRNEDIERNKDITKTEFFQLFNEIQGSDSEKEILANQYVLNLEGGDRNLILLPFHPIIGAGVKMLGKKTKTGKENEIYSRILKAEHLLDFMSDEQGKINYDLIKKIFNTFNNHDDLNFLEKFVVKKIEEKLSITTQDDLLLKEEEVLQSIIDSNRNDGLNVCYHQRKAFQSHLNLILDIKNISRVERLNLFQKTIWFHFSNYIMRIFYIIYLEAENFDTDKGDYCNPDNCKGFESCPLTKEPLLFQTHFTPYQSRTSAELKVLFKQHIDKITKGYDAMIAFNHLQQFVFEKLSKNKNNSIKLKDIHLLDIKNEYKKDKLNFNNEFLKYLIKASDDTKYENIMKIIRNRLNNNSQNPFKVLMDSFRNDYYANSSQKTDETKTKRILTKLAGTKMGCGFVFVPSTRRLEISKFYFEPEFIYLISNLILNTRDKIRIKDFWKELKKFGLDYFNTQEKNNFELQLVEFGMLERKSDAGECEYVTKSL
jgi:hypothetical protein